MARMKHNNSTDLVVDHGKYQGNEFVNIRQYTTFGNDDPGGRPTKKGIALQHRELDFVIVCLSKLRDELNAKGIKTSE
jgi:hypothetical protein